MPALSDTIDNFPLSANEVGGEGRGEVAFNSNPLAPALSPLGRGEGVDGNIKLRLSNVD